MPRAALFILVMLSSPVLCSAQPAPLYMVTPAEPHTPSQPTISLEKVHH